jgi:hypothetical protein
MAINVDTYTGHTWVDNSTPDLEAEVLNEIEEGIRKNNTAIKAVLNALVSQITNDPDKFASMAALYAVNQNLGTLSTTVTNINSNLSVIGDASSVSPPSYVSCDSGISKEITMLTLPAGVYVVSAYLGWSDTVRGGSRRIYIRQGDYYNAQIIAADATDDFKTDAAPMEQSASGIVVLPTGSNIKLWVTQTSGSNLSVGSTAFLKAVRIK